MALVVVDKAQIDGLVAAIATLKTDESTVLADVAAALKAGIPTADPATAAVMTQAVTDLTAADTALKAADPGTVPTAPAPPGSFGVGCECITGESQTPVNSTDHVEREGNGGSPASSTTRATLRGGPSVLEPPYHCASRQSCGILSL